MRTPVSMHRILQRRLLRIAHSIGYKDALNDLASIVRIPHLNAARKKQIPSTSAWHIFANTFKEHFEISSKCFNEFSTFVKKSFGNVPRWKGYSLLGFEIDSPSTSNLLRYFILLASGRACNLDMSAGKSFCFFISRFSLGIIEVVSS